MPAGFNKGQIEYIKSIANVNGHKSYVTKEVGDSSRTNVGGTVSDSDAKLKWNLWTLGTAPLVYSHTSHDVPATLSPCTSLDVYNVPINTNTETASAAQRVTPECFLESVNMKMRLITNLDDQIGSQSHKEYRFVVFRHKEKQSHIHNLASNFSNPLYDMFHGASNFKYGVKGLTLKMDNHGSVNYSAWGAGTYNRRYDSDAMMTDSINKEDYVVMKDCRIYLGREYGGKHIFEDRMHWDHEDPIATDLDDLSTTDSDKNYVWYAMLLCHNNTSVGVDNLGYVSLLTNTYVTSG